MTVPEIDIVALEAALAEGSPLIDVREPAEFVEVRVPSAKLIPLGTVTERVAEIPAAGTVYIICRSGARSARAAEFLRTQGIDAVNVAGGTMAWVESGRPLDTGAGSTS